MYESEEEMSPLHEYTLEADPFFGKIGRAFKGLAKRAAPILKKLAPIAARVVAGAIPGVGGIAGPLAGKLVGALTREQQQELEAVLQEVAALQPEYQPEYQPEGGIPSGEYQPEAWMGEGEYQPEAWAAEGEYQPETAWEYQPSMEAEAAYPEAEYGVGQSETALQEAGLMEQIAQEAAETLNEADSEALAGSLAPLAIRGVRMAAPVRRRLAPALTRASGRLVGTLRSNPATRPLIRVVPTVLRRTSIALARQAGQGAPVTPKTAVRAMANQTYRVMSNPAVCIQILIRSGRLRRRFLVPPAPETM